MPAPASVLAGAASFDALLCLLQKFSEDVFFKPFIDKDDIWEYVARLDPFCLSLVILAAFTAYVYAVVHPMHIIYRLQRLQF
jgi:hypothetical protein